MTIDLVMTKRSLLTTRLTLTIKHTKAMEPKEAINRIKAMEHGYQMMPVAVQTLAETVQTPLLLLPGDSTRFY
jgi:hypothetical protein